MGVRPTAASIEREPGMSKLIERKWRIASGVGFAAAIAFDLIAKHIGAERMQSIARRAAGMPMEPGGLSAGHFSFGIVQTFGLVVAAIGAIFWGVSACRSEPGSSLPVVI